MGQIAFTDKPVYIRTVVGGCIAITMYDKSSHFSSMCHALYPGEKECCLYAVDSVKNMVHTFKKKGISLEKLEVKLFGAASQFTRNGETTIQIQEKIEQLTSIIREMGISYIKTDLGGIKTRELLFDTETGKVFLKYLENILIESENSDG